MHITLSQIRYCLFTCRLRLKELVMQILLCPSYFIGIFLLPVCYLYTVCVVVLLFTDRLAVGSASLLLLLLLLLLCLLNSVLFQLVLYALSYSLLMFRFLFCVVSPCVYCLLRISIIQNILLTTGPNSDCQQRFVAPTFSGFLNAWFVSVGILKGQSLRINCSHFRRLSKKLQNATEAIEVTV